MPHKLLIFTAPSGAGKTTIVRYLLREIPGLAFSVSATTRPRRPHEVDGRDYYFISPEEFLAKVAANEFVEWEEVYAGLYYGTLHQELDRLWAAGKDILFDIDVKGALNLQAAYPDRSLSIFIKPPSEAVLRERLRKRDTETEASLRKRLDRAAEELAYADRFDRILINDDLEEALAAAMEMVTTFLGEAPNLR